MIEPGGQCFAAGCDVGIYAHGYGYGVGIQQFLAVFKSIPAFKMLAA